MFTTKLLFYEERIIKLINQLLLNDIVYRQLSFKYNINLYIKIIKTLLKFFFIYFNFTFKCFIFIFGIIKLLFQSCDC